MHFICNFVEDTATPFSTFLSFLSSSLASLAGFGSVPSDLLDFPQRLSPWDCFLWPSVLLALDEAAAGELLGSATAFADCFEGPVAVSSSFSSCFFVVISPGVAGTTWPGRSKPTSFPGLEMST